jgi:hypothetical protein
VAEVASEHGLPWSAVQAAIGAGHRRDPVRVPAVGPGAPRGRDHQLAAGPIRGRPGSSTSPANRALLGQIDRRRRRSLIHLLDQRDQAFRGAVRVVAVARPRPTRPRCVRWHVCPQAPPAIRRPGRCRDPAPQGASCCVAAAARALTASRLGEGAQAFQGFRAEHETGVAGGERGSPAGHPGDRDRGFLEQQTRRLLRRKAERGDVEEQRLAGGRGDKRHSGRPRGSRRAAARTRPRTAARVPGRRDAVMNRTRSTVVGAGHRTRDAGVPQALAGDAAQVRGIVDLRPGASSSSAASDPATSRHPPQGTRAQRLQMSAAIGSSIWSPKSERREDAPSAGLAVISGQGCLSFAPRSRCDRCSSPASRSANSITKGESGPLRPCRTRPAGATCQSPPTRLRGGVASGCQGVWKLTPLRPFCATITAANRCRPDRPIPCRWTSIGASTRPTDLANEDGPDDLVVILTEGVARVRQGLADVLGEHVWPGIGVGRARHL